MEMIHFAEREITDHTQASIAIMVGIFGVLLLFSDIEKTHENQNLWRSNIPLMLTLTAVYGGLLFFGLKFTIERQIFYVLRENLYRQCYSEYNTNLKKISDINWLTKQALRRTRNEAGQERKEAGQEKSEDFRWTSYDLIALIMPAILYPLVFFALWYFIANPH